MDSIERSLDNHARETREAFRDVVAQIGEMRQELKGEVADLAKSVHDVAQDISETKDVVAAWKFAKTWSSFAKWVLGLGSAAIAFWIAVKSLLPLPR